jgi:predicted RNA-binding protein YlxR (DUF448 family)
VGCRAVEPQAQLVRVALVNGALARAPRGGRGAWLHARAACIEAAGRGALARALRGAVHGEDVARVMSSLSRDDDDLSENGAGHDRAAAVEITPRFTPSTEDQPNQDARL